MLKGLEAIQFQSNPKAFKALTAVFQAAMDFRDSLDYSKKGNLSEPQYRDIQMLKYCKNTLEADFKQCVKTQFNLTVKTMEFNTNQGNSAGLTPFSGCFAVQMAMDDVNNVTNQMAVYSGYKNVGSDTTNEAFQELASMIDPSTGRVSNTEYGKNLKKPKAIFCIIYFDQVSAFLVKDRVNENLVEDIVAEEVAAIMLHEIGHMLTLIEHSADQYYRVQRVTAHIDNILTYSNKDELINVVLPKTQELVNTLKEKDNTGEFEKISKVLETINYACRKVDESYPSSVIRLLMQILYLVLRVCLGLCVKSILIDRILLILIERTVTDVFFKTSVAGSKSSDTMNGPRNYYHIERLADEFISRMGAGSYVASSLKKLWRAFEVDKLTVYSQRLNKSKFIATLLATYINVLGTVSKAINPSYPIYEDNTARIERFLQNNMAVFKNHLPPQVLDWYIKDTNRILQQLKAQKTKSAAVTKLLAKIFDLCPITSPGAFLLRLTTGNITKDVDNLLKDVEAITNTKLNFFGARFIQLAEAKTGNEAFDYMMSQDNWEAFDTYVNYS
jgi:hypothetical protein